MPHKLKTSQAMGSHYQLAVDAADTTSAKYLSAEMAQAIGVPLHLAPVAILGSRLMAGPRKVS